MKAAYPQHSSVFGRTGHWENVTNQREFFDKLGSSLNIRHYKDWNQVSVRTVQDKGGSFVNRIYNGSLKKGNYIIMEYNHWQHCGLYILNIIGMTWSLLGKVDIGMTLPTNVPVWTHWQ